MISVRNGWGKNHRTGLLFDQSNRIVLGKWKYSDYGIVFILSQRENPCVRRDLSRHRRSGIIMSVAATNNRCEHFQCKRFFVVIFQQPIGTGSSLQSPFWIIHYRRSNHRMKRAQQVNNWKRTDGENCISSTCSPEKPWIFALFQNRQKLITTASLPKELPAKSYPESVAEFLRGGAILRSNGSVVEKCDVIEIVG